MTNPDSSITAIQMPQVNVNDEEVTLVGWHVADGATVVEGEPLCEVETSKAVGDVPAPVGGVLRHVARVGDVVAVGEVFAYAGPSVDAIDRHLADVQKSKPAEAERSSVKAPVEATAGAVELAQRYGIDLTDVPTSGRIRRTDVQQLIAERGLSEPSARTASHGTAPAGALPPALADKVSDGGELSDHQWAVAEHLTRTQSRLVVGHVVMDVSARSAVDWIDAKRQASVMTGVIPILLQAAGAAVRAEPRLASFRIGRRVYKYRAVDIAYTARSGDGRLFAPVVRGVDRLSLDELAAECSRLNMAVFRGKLDPADMASGCLTVSVLSDHPVRFHVGLQNAYQSAVLTAGDIQDRLRMIDGQPAAEPTLTLTLSYDHGLMDGWEAAAALDAARVAIETAHV